MLDSLEFKLLAKLHKAHFIRNRKLTFKRLLVFMMMKSVKSLQNSLNEFFDKISDNFETVSASAFSKARSKLSHQAFIALNEKAIVDVFYSDPQFKTYKGLRILAIDGSKIYLPNTPDLGEAFGKIKIKNQQDCGEYVSGLASVMYDVLNQLAVDSQFVRNDIYEGDLALEHIKKTQKNDLILCDRGYLSYFLMAKILKQDRDFLFRCSTASFKSVQEMFWSDVDSKLVTLQVPVDQRKRCKESDVLESITVRLVKVILETGETEVLITSLLDAEKYPTSSFKELYWMRWGIETFYDTIKNTLTLENFTGKSVEAVKQDFYSTIFILNLGTIMTADTEEQMVENNFKNKNATKVNKSISFNVLKNNIIYLFYTEGSNSEKLIRHMEILFAQRATPIRKNRSYPRDKNNIRKSANFYKRRKKYCF